MNSNPYLPPAEIDLDSPETLPERESDLRPMSFLIRWPLVLFLNLVMPLTLASGLLRNTGLIGVLAAVSFVWLVGWWAWRRWPQIGRRVIAGGWVVCVCQLFPLIQIFAGLAALSIAEELGLMDSLDLEQNGPNFESEFASAFVTLITGGILMLVSLAVGAVLIAVLDHFRRPKLG